MESNNMLLAAIDMSLQACDTLYACVRMCFVWMCVCVYMCVYLSVFVLVCVCVCVYVRICVRACVRVFVYVRFGVCACMCTYTNTCTISLFCVVTLNPVSYVLLGPRDSNK